MLAKKPVYSPKDLEGAKMRVPEIEMYFRAWKAMGARPMQTPASEIYLALMQGVVDAMEGPLNAIFSLKLHEAAKNITVTNHLLSALCIYVNDNKFQGLDKELQDILVEGAEEGGRVYTKLGIDNYDRDKKEMEAKGVKFITVDVKPFQEKMKPLIAEVEAEGKMGQGARSGKNPEHKIASFDTLRVRKGIPAPLQRRASAHARDLKDGEWIY